MPHCHRDAVMPGDGKGREVVPKGVRSLQAAGQRFDLGIKTIVGWVR